MNNQLNALIEKIVSQKLAEAQGIRREPAVVVSADSSNTKATVRFLNGSEYELLNKTGEVLTAGNSVWIEYRTLPSAGYIALRNGEAEPWKVECYSTEERCIGYWIDNSELYEKTYVVTALGDSSARSVTVSLGISRLGEIVESRGQLMGSGFSRPLESMPVSSSGIDAEAIDATCYSLSPTDLTVYNGTTDRSGCKAYVTIRYTKANETHTDIEYIRSTGTQFIDTDIYMNIASQRIELDCMFSNYELSANNDIFCGGALDTAPSANWKKISIWTSYDRFSNYNFGVSCPYLVMDEISSLSDYSTRGVASLQPNGNCGWNNGFTATGTYQASSSVPIRIFGYKGESSSDDTIFSHANMTLYSLKIIDLSSGSLLHNLTPARRDQDGAVGLYDNVTGKFYGNAGTDPFIVPT